MYNITQLVIDSAQSPCNLNVVQGLEGFFFRADGGGHGMDRAAGQQFLQLPAHPAGGTVDDDVHRDTSYTLTPLARMAASRRWKLASSMGVRGRRR